MLYQISIGHIGNAVEHDHEILMQLCGQHFISSLSYINFLSKPRNTCLGVCFPGNHVIPQDTRMQNVFLL